jgi:hypothetical protein
VLQITSAEAQIAYRIKTVSIQISLAAIQNLGDAGVNPIPPCPLEKVDPAMCDRFRPGEGYVLVVPPLLISLVAVALPGLASPNLLPASVNAEY